jgi:cell division protein FtsW
MMRTRQFTATAIVLAVLSMLQAWALLRAPAAWFPAAIQVRLAPGEAVTLGQRELAAPQADRAHLQLRRDAGGAWQLRSLSATRPVTLFQGSDEQRMGSAPVAQAPRFQVGGSSFDVLREQASSGIVAFKLSGADAATAAIWRYDGATLYRNGSAQQACADAHPAARLVALWNRAMPGALTFARPLAFGGNVHCGNRLGLPGLVPGAAVLARSNGQLVLMAGAQDDGHTALRVSDTVRQVDLRQQEQPLAGITAFSAGRSRFQLDLQGDVATLAPSRNVALFTVPDARKVAHVDWQWRKRALWDWRTAPAVWLALAAAIACLALPALPMLVKSPARAHDAGGHRYAMTSGPLAAAAVAMLAAGIAAIVAQRGGHPPGAVCSLVLGAAALALWLAVPARLPLPVAAALMLLAAGLLAQLELGLGAHESSWLRYYQKSSALLAIGGGAAVLWHLWSCRAQRATPQRTIEWLLAALAIVALAALAAQVMWGDETGVFDLQPVELAKLALTALTAHCLALRMGWTEPDRRRPSQALRWLQLSAPALLFLALLGLALVQVDDYSPLILLLVWSMAMAFAYALAARKRVLAMLLAAVALSAIAAIAMVRSAGADGMAQWPLTANFYADRFQVWLAPATHPHTGQQLLLGARAIADGGWWGADSMLGLRSLGLPAGSAVNIPAVQDDFAPSFFLNRHGLLGALLLWTAQAALLAGIVHVAARAYAAAALARNFRQAWLGRFRYFALCGGAAFVFGHLLLSWGTNLAIFPIMGQPMSFLSAGGSHLLFFLSPLLAFCAISAQSLEENESCRSTSNMKS